MTMCETMPKTLCATCGEKFLGWAIKYQPIVKCPYCGAIHEKDLSEYPLKGIEEAIDQE